MEDRSALKSVPFGLIFSVFMVSIMIGSLAFKKLIQFGTSIPTICRLAFGLAAVAFLVPLRQRPILPAVL